MKEYLLPVKIVKEKNTTNSNLLFESKTMQVSLTETNVFEINGKGFIILDFGEELCGGIRILTHSVLPNNLTKVHISFGESLAETCSTLFEKGACNDHSPRDFDCEIVRLSDLTFGQTGFRYVKIENLEETTLRIRSIVAENNYFSQESIYTYNGSDKKIKKIFDCAKRTIDLCCSSDFVWDGIKRDRLVWAGDMHPEMLALVSLYGNVDNIERSLDFIKDNTKNLMFMNNYTTYSMWWIITVIDYYYLTNNVDFIKKHIKDIEYMISLFNDNVGDNGELYYSDYFVDWPTCGTEDEIQGNRAINIICAKKAIQVLKEFDIDNSKAIELLEKLKKVPIVVNEKKQVIALKYFAEDYLSDEDYNKLIDGGIKGLSTFMAYYVLTAIASKNKEKAISMLKEYYGKMIELGATTFWEDFNVDWCDENTNGITSFECKGKKNIHADYGAFCYVGFRHSLCHGWSAGIIKFIKDNC